MPTGFRGFQKGGNPNPLGNPNIREISKYSTGPKTTLGKFRVALNKYRGKDRGQMPIPEEIKELFEWTISMNTSELNQLTELKNIYQVLKSKSAEAIFNKILDGKELDKNDLELIKILQNNLIESYKLEHGSKSTVEHKVTYKDIRDQIFTDKEIIDAKIISNEDEGKEDVLL